jgi:hypothetical protein
MAKITHSRSACLLGPEFDDFLFAPICEEKNGMLLRVVSALARLDLDPWQETTSLACLPEGKAVERLAGLIAALPDGPLVHRDPMAIASGLIARLPRRLNSNGPLADKTSGKANLAVIQPQDFLFIAFILVVVFGNLASAGSPRLAANLNNTPATTASEIISPAPSSTSILK